MVLVVEDHPLTLEVIARLLRMRGHDARTAPSGYAAVHVMSLVRPDLAMMDICMPGIDGIQVLRAIRNDPSLREMPVIIFTAHEDLACDARQIGAQECFIKGRTSWGTILGCIDELVARHHAA